MEKFGITAEQAAGGSPDLRWLRTADTLEKTWVLAGDRLPVGVEAFLGKDPKDLVHLDREPACGHCRRLTRRLRPGPGDQRQVATRRSDARGGRPGDAPAARASGRARAPDARGPHRPSRPRARPGLELDPHDDPARTAWSRRAVFSASACVQGFSSDIATRYSGPSFGSVLPPREQPDVHVRELRHRRPDVHPVRLCDFFDRRDDLARRCGEGRGLFGVHLGEVEKVATGLEDNRACGCPALGYMAGPPSAVVVDPASGRTFLAALGPAEPAGLSRRVADLCVGHSSALLQPRPKEAA